ncbi:MAG: DUF2855 domain-containing protein, partial [Pseudomonadota bacterium]
KELGSEVFNKQSSDFILGAAMKSRDWLRLRTLNGLDGLNEVYGEVLAGKADPRDGFLIEM